LTEIEGIYSLKYCAYQRNGTELNFIRKNPSNEMYVGLVNLSKENDTYFLTNKGNVYSMKKDFPIFKNVKKMNSFGESLILLGIQKN
jgi:hypothetical protein